MIEDELPPRETVPIDFDKWWDNLPVVRKAERHSQRRFELVKIAFKQALANQSNRELRKVWSKDTPIHLAANVIEMADAVLAQMEKNPATEPDTKERTE